MADIPFVDIPLAQRPLETHAGAVDRMCLVDGGIAKYCRLMLKNAVISQNISTTYLKVFFILFFKTVVVTVSLSWFILG